MRTILTLFAALIGGLILLSIFTVVVAIALPNVVRSGHFEVGFPGLFLSGRFLLMLGMILGVVLLIRAAVQPRRAQGRRMIRASESAVELMLGMILGVVLLIRASVQPRRVRPGRATPVSAPDSELARSFDELNRSLERMEKRIANLETILSEQPPPLYTTREYR